MVTQSKAIDLRMGGVCVTVCNNFKRHFQDLLGDNLIHLCIPVLCIPNWTVSNVNKLRVERQDSLYVFHLLNGIKSNLIRNMLSGYMAVAIANGPC